jgi:hypothetical protein
LITPLDDLLDVVQMRLQSADDDMCLYVLGTMSDDLTSARKKYVEALRYWKERQECGRKRNEKLDESFERIVRMEMEECDALIERVQQGL